MLAAGRDGYRFLHDQTSRLANLGLNKEEIADRLVFPVELANIWELRGYYGSVNRNFRGIYTFYFAWFDGNPVNLNHLPPAERAKRYLESHLSRAASGVEGLEFRFRTPSGIPGRVAVCGLPALRIGNLHSGGSRTTGSSRGPPVTRWRR